MKNVILASAVIIIFILLTFFLLSGNKKDATLLKQIDKSDDRAPLTMQEITRHATANDCWLVIRDKVYDVTDFITSHPGGEAILSGCGKDATTLFDTRPMGSNTPHSQKANEKLNGFYVGDLVR